MRHKTAPAPASGRRASCILAFLAIAVTAGCAATTDGIYARALIVEPDEVLEAEAALVEVIRDAEEDESRRCIAIESLVRLRGAAAVPVLAEASCPGYPTSLRRWAIWALGQTRDAAAVGPVLAAWHPGTDEQTTLRTLEAITKLAEQIRTNDEWTKGALAVVNSAHTRHSASDGVSRYVGLIFSDLMTAQCALELIDEKAREKDCPSLFNLVSWLGQYVTERLNEPGNKEAGKGVAVLSGLTTYRHSPDVRYRAIWFLGRFGHPAASDALLRAARRGPDAMTRLLALWALSRVAPRRLASEFEALPDELLAMTPAGWRASRRAAAALGERDLEVQRFIARRLREEVAP